MAKTLYLISGIPGSGKSTLAMNLLKAGVASVFFEADQYFTKNGEYKFDSSKISEAHEECFFKTFDAMCRGLNIIVANTFTKDVFINKYIALAKKSEYNIIEIVMKSTFDSIHQVPPSTVNNMKLQLQQRLNSDWALM